MRMKGKRWDWDLDNERLGINEDYLRNIVSDLFEKLKSYLIRLQLAKRSEWEDYHFLRFLCENDVSREIFIRFFKRLEKKVNKRLSPGGELDKWNLRLAALNHRNLVSLQLRKLPKEKANSIPENPYFSLVQHMNSLDRKYFFHRIRLSLELNSTKFSVGASPLEPIFPIEETDWIVKKLSAFDSEKSRIYSLIWGLLYHDNRSNYPNLKTTLENTQLDKNEKLKLCMLLQNYCIGRLNEGESVFAEEYVFWMDQRIKKGFLLLEGKLLFNEFKNYITCCIKCPNPNAIKAEAFFKKYLKHLKQPFKKEDLIISEAEIYFANERYQEVTQMFPLKGMVDTEDSYLRYDAKWLLAKALYMVDDVEHLPNILKSLQMFFYRTKDIPPTRAKSHENKIRILDRLTKTLPEEKKALKRLLKDIENTNPLADREWLREEAMRKWKK